MSDLHYLSVENATAEQALAGYVKLLGGQRAVAMLYTAARCRLAIVSSHGVSDETGATIDLKQVFEWRAFNVQHECRWLHLGGGQGRAVVLSGEPLGELAGWQPSVRSELETIEQEYLLWGTATGDVSAAGWPELYEARIGPFYVPLLPEGAEVDAASGGAGASSLHQQDKVVLKAIEYVGDGDQDGNATVCEERLTALQPYRPPAKEESQAASS